MLKSRGWNQQALVMLLCEINSVPKPEEQKVVAQSELRRIWRFFSTNSSSVKIPSSLSLVSFLIVCILIVLAIKIELSMNRIVITPNMVRTFKLQKYIITH